VDGEQLTGNVDNVDNVPSVTGPRVPQA